MGFAAGSTCFSQAPVYVSQFPSSSAPSCSFWQSLSWNPRNAEVKERSGVPMACRSKTYLNDDGFCKRRAILFLGISVFPLLQLKAQALESSAPEKTEAKTREGNQNAELGFQTEKPPNPVLSLLNGLGIFCSGVLGSLYALAQKEKKATDEEIQSIKTELKEKESSILSMKRNFESKLLNEQEERTKQSRKAKEEHLSLVSQLNSANLTIGGLGQELRNEKQVIEELNTRIGSLQTRLSKTEEEKQMLEAKLQESLQSIGLLQERVNLLGSELKDKENDVQRISSSLAEKEVELKNLFSSFKQARDEAAKANSDVHVLTDELSKTKEDLELKNSTVDELNARVTSLVLERDEYKRDFHTKEEEYHRLKLASEEKASSDAKLIREIELEIQKLQEKLGISVKEASENQTTIDELTQERDVLRKKLELESSNAQTLKNELSTAHESLIESRNEASDLRKQLEDSKNTCTELQSEVSRLQAEYAEVKSSLRKKLEEAKQNGEILAGELSAAKDLLVKTNDELQLVSNELASTIETREGLKNEVADAHQKAETVSKDLDKERKVVSSLNKRLQTMEKQNLEDKEARKSLETDLEEATKSLDEMNRNAMILYKELEKSNSHVSTLEGEKEVLLKTLTEHKNASKEAKENLEDAHSLIMMLGKERESHEKRAKKLEEELTSAKGEILRLRSKMNSSNGTVNNQQQQKQQQPAAEEAESKGKSKGKVTVTVKKNARRRKSGSQSDKELS